MTLEDIGEGNDALLCMTNLTGFCGRSENRSVLGDWYFPNGTVVPSSGEQWNFYRTRDQMVVRLNRRRGGVEGIYCCEIPDSMNVTQTVHIGVYITVSVCSLVLVTLFVHSCSVQLESYGSANVAEE